MDQSCQLCEFDLTFLLDVFRNMWGQGKLSKHLKFLVFIIVWDRKFEKNINI